MSEAALRSTLTGPYPHTNLSLEIQRTGFRGFLNLCGGLGLTKMCNRIDRMSLEPTGFEHVMGCFCGATKLLAPTMMRDLPGFYYDANRQRYFPESSRPKSSSQPLHVPESRQPESGAKNDDTQWNFNASIAQVRRSHSQMTRDGAQQ